MKAQHDTETCKGCGRPLAEVGTQPVAGGRRWDDRQGWHNFTATACRWCGTWTSWYDEIPQTADDLKKYAAARGSHFFDPDTMRFFSSRILEGVTVHDGRAYFVTSERDNYTNQPRRYTARYMAAGAHISKVGVFQQYETAAQARAAIRNAIKED